MMNFNCLMGVLSKNAGRTGLVLQKISPEIMLYAGIGGVVVSTVLACNGKTKADVIMDEAAEKMDKIEAVRGMELVDYADLDYRKDKVIVMGTTAMKILRVYAPAIGVGLFSIGLIVGSHTIMKSRNVALAAAFKAVDMGFKSYRRRVVEELGEEVDHNYRYGIRKQEVIEIEEDAKGKKKEIKNVVEAVDPSHYSIYARFFDEGCTEWSKTPEYNLMFLNAQQRYANDLLHARGHIFLNEVYDNLGIPRSQAGAVVGWVLGEGYGNFVDFGIYDVDSNAGRNFVNGNERTILLDFNVDGVIYDLI